MSYRLRVGIYLARKSRKHIQESRILEVFRRGLLFLAKGSASDKQKVYKCESKRRGRDFLPYILGNYDDEKWVTFLTRAGASVRRHGLFCRRTSDAISHISITITGESAIKT